MWAGSHKRHAWAISVEPDVLAKLSSAARQLPTSTILTPFSFGCTHEYGRPFCRVRMVGELLAMPLAQGAEVSSNVPKRIMEPGNETRSDWQ